MTEAHVWVVEMLPGKGRVWAPTVGVALTRTAARQKRDDWERKCPDDGFRVTKYRQEAPDD